MPPQAIAIDEPQGEVIQGIPMDEEELGKEGQVEVKDKQAGNGDLVIDGDEWSIGWLLITLPNLEWTLKLSILFFISAVVGIKV